jgi:hypothetical protein
MATTKIRKHKIKKYLAGGWGCGGGGESFN